MTMNARKTILATLLAAAVIAPPAIAPVHAQVHAQAPRVYNQAELDQMLAPIALYPDALLSQVLMAATYPIEVVEAARWSRANSGLQGDDAVRAVQNEDWDPSVISLVAFPQILARMDENPAWTRSLGDAFRMQEPHVMDTVQQLRRRAQAAGNLQSSEQLNVQQQGQIIVVQPASPQYIYVPYYDPLEVYGPWWWPAYRPVVWAPWYGYRRYYLPGISVGFWWGSPVGLSLNFFFGDFDWRERQVRVAYPTAYYYRPAYASGRSVAVAPQRWRHDAQRREAFAERRAVQARQQIQVESSPRRQERGVAVTPERAVQAQPQTQARPRPERREERESARSERRETRQTQPQAQPQPQVQAQPQPQTQPRSERREERESARTERRETRQAQPQAQPQPRAQPEVRPQPQVRAQPEARPQPQARPEQRPQPQARQEQRAAMPAAQATQTPRAERQERREQRHDKREDKGQKTG